MPLRRTQLTVSDLIIRLQTIPNPDHTAIFVSDEPGDIHVAGSVFYRHLPIWESEYFLIKNLDICQACMSCRPEEAYQDPNEPCPVTSKDLCLRTEISQVFVVAQKLIEKPAYYLSWQKTPHPHTMRNKEGTYVTDPNDAFAFTPSAALRCTLNKCYPNARDTHRGALHCLELAASVNGWKGPDQNPPQLNHNQSHIIAMQIMKAAQNFACNMTPHDWKIVVENYPEMISPETTNQESQPHV